MLRYIPKVINNYALTIICGFTAFISVNYLLAKSITTIKYRVACHYVIGFLGGKLIGNFSPSSCLINLHINNISSNSFL